MKILLLDADGVTLKKHGYFSEKFAEEYDVPPEEIIPFFKNEFRKCQAGEADLKEELVPYLKVWKWNKSVQDFMDYWFETDTEIDDEVMDLVQTLRDRGVTCYLTTDQEKYRAEFIRQRMNGKLDGFFFSCEVGASKDSPEFFEDVIKKLGVSPGDISYIDDEKRNVDAAQGLGIDAHFYTGIADLKHFL